MTVSGWVRSVRASKTVGFLMLSDGTFFEQLQVVYEQCLENFVQISRLNVGAAVVVTGIVTAAPNAKQPFELHAQTVQIEGASAPDYPLQKEAFL